MGGGRPARRLTLRRCSSACELTNVRLLLSSTVKALISSSVSPHANTSPGTDSASYDQDATHELSSSCPAGRHHRGTVKRTRDGGGTS